jgi:hypothetical protein
LLERRLERGVGAIARKLRNKYAGATCPVKPAKELPELFPTRGQKLWVIPLTPAEPSYFCAGTRPVEVVPEEFKVISPWFSGLSLCSKRLNDWHEELDCR